MKTRLKTMANLKNLTIDGSGDVKIPVGTTSQRPTNPTLGMFRWNSSLETMEHYNGTEWIKTSTGEPI